MPFKSKKQWRWAFVNKKSFARKWAHKTASFKALPKTARTQKRRRRG
jgi:hypothetical protein